MAEQFISEVEYLAAEEKSLGGWLLRSYNEREDIVELAPWNIALPLAQLYEDVEVPDGLLPLRSADEAGEI